MKQNGILKILLWAGVLFTVLGLLTGGRSLLIIVQGTASMGQVIELIESATDDNSVLFTPKVSFVANDGYTYTFVSNVSHSPSPYMVGETIKVIYNEKKPNVANIYSFADLGLIPFVSIDVGVFTIFASWLARRFMKKKLDTESI